MTLTPAFNGLSRPLPQMFKNDGFDYFTEMMPALHNYITVDTEGFLSSEARIAAVFEMCKTMMTQVRGQEEED